MRHILTSQERTGRQQRQLDEPQEPRSHLAFEQFWSGQARAIWASICTMHSRWSSLTMQCSWCATRLPRLKVAACSARHLRVGTCCSWPSPCAPRWHAAAHPRSARPQARSSDMRRPLSRSLASPPPAPPAQCASLWTHLQCCALPELPNATGAQISRLDAGRANTDGI